MLTEISLNNLVYKAFHGIYKEEQINGNTFSLDVCVTTHLDKSTISDLSKGVDYEVVATICNEFMEIATPLLETVVFSIGEKILLTFASQAVKVKVTLRKHNPPINATCDNSQVSIVLTMDDIIE